MLGLPDLRLGRMLAEGGEGRVYELGGDLVFKQFRHQRPSEQVEPLVQYAAELGAANAGSAARLCSSSAWPLATVVGDDPAHAVGVVLPRAPRQFWLSHRDGPLRLATLSYLAGDPDRIELAYGVAVPAPGAAARVAVVYALARLLEAWQAGGPGEVGQVAHGDLSAKNVLWSLSPAPAVYVLDCDGARIGAAGAGAPRATTPNWEDPALGPGEAPGPASDRYVLALVFLRVLGGAHFPVQVRQRSSDQVNIDLELPRSWRKLPDMGELWELCERSLSLTTADERPSPREWCAGLEDLLDELGAAPMAAAVRTAQGDAVASRGAEEPAPRPRVTVPDVVVRPVLRSRAPSTWQLVSVRRPLVGPAGEMVLGGPSAYRSPLGARQVARQGLSMWGRAHRMAGRMVRSPGRRAHGLRRLAGMVVLDLAAACVGLFLFGMIVSPWIGL